MGQADVDRSVVAMTEDETDVAKCPVFEKGCPFKESEETLQRLKNCPAFKDGCAFKEVRFRFNVNEIRLQNLHH